jgi:hypothetical protein
MSVLSTVLAQGTTHFNLGPGGGQFANLTGITVGSIISAGIQILLIVTSIILLFVLIIGGITVMTAGAEGNPQKTAQGQQAVTAAIIGLVIVFGAWAVISLINLFFGVDILQLNIPNAQNN